MQSASEEQQGGQEAAGAASNDVVYKKGCIEAAYWSYNWRNDDSGAFFSMWAHSFTTMKPRIVRPASDKLKWFSNHLDMPDDVSILVHAFIVKDMIPPNVINLNRRKLGVAEYRKEKKSGPFVLLDGINVRDVGRYFAVVDSQNANRVLIAQDTSVGGTRRKVCGGIWYFDDDDGKVEECLAPFSAELFVYDWTNGNPTPDNVFLCGDALCSHCDVGVDGWILQEDKLVGKYICLKKWFNAGESEHGYRSSKSFKSWMLDGRWLCSISNSASTLFCLDLKSIQKGTNDDMMYDCLEIPSSMDAMSAIKSLKDVPSYEITERDGYPVKCIKCGEDTVSGGMKWSACQSACTAIGLGKGACEQCQIRFSESSKNWRCWQMTEKDYGIGYSYVDRCSQVVDGPDYQCKEVHLGGDRMNYQVDRKRSRYQDEIEVIIAYWKAKGNSTAA